MSELSEYREALAEVLSPHYLTTPVQCACGWRETDGHGVTYARHQVDALLASPVLAQIVADAKAAALREAADDIEAVRESGRLPEGYASHPIVGDDWLRDRAARIAREPDTDRPDTAGEEKP